MVRLVRLVMGGSVKGVASGIDWVTAGDEMNSGETGGKFLSGLVPAGRIGRLVGGKIMEKGQ